MLHIVKDDDHQPYFDDESVQELIQACTEEIQALEHEKAVITQRQEDLVQLRRRLMDRQAGQHHGQEDSQKEQQHSA